MSDVLPLSATERERYSRQILLPGVGLEGQQRLKEASVLVVGAGGLGSPATLYLAAAGVGRIGLVDFDRVDRSNLHRQVLYGESDIGRRKLDAAVDRLVDLNPDVKVEPHPVRLDAETALDLVADYDVVADGTDNFATRFLVNDACVLQSTPNAFASIHRFDGQASVFAAPGGPCYRCVFPEPPPAGLVPSCAEGGVLGVLPGLLGTIQATEVLKLILGIGEPLVGRLLLADTLGMTFRTLEVVRDPSCPVCGDVPTITTPQESAASCGSPPFSPMSTIHEITPEQLRDRQQAGDRPVLLDVRQPEEFAVASLEDAVLLPLGQLPARAFELDAHRDEPIVVYCHHGGRSAQAVRFLQEQGFTDVANLRGGIHAWSETVDPSVPTY